jgi:hypothetical protein
MLDHSGQQIVILVLGKVRERLAVSKCTEFI